MEYICDLFDYCTKEKSCSKFFGNVTRTQNTCIVWGPLGPLHSEGTIAFCSVMVFETAVQRYVLVYQSTNERRMHGN